MKPNRDLIGWAVEILRGDGSSFFACGPGSASTPIWHLKNKRSADLYSEDLKTHGFETRLVRVRYREPIKIQKSKSPYAQ